MTNTFQMESQAQTEWCWAAVGATINRYFSPDVILEQCQLATALLPGNPSCCAKPLPAGANAPAPLQDALTFIGALKETKAQTALPFNDIQTQINTSFPVCARIGWRGELRGHFIAIWGFSVTASGEQWVDVADPFFGDSTIPYTELVHSYQQDGEWTDTFLVKKP